VWKGVELMDCPHCGWSLKVIEETVSVEGYLAKMECSSKPKCKVVIHLNTDLLWAYENNRILLTLKNEAYALLLANGFLTAPPKLISKPSNS